MKGVIAIEYSGRYSQTHSMYYMFDVTSTISNTCQLVNLRGVSSYASFKASMLNAPIHKRATVLCVHYIRSCGGDYSSP